MTRILLGSLLAVFTLTAAEPTGTLAGTVLTPREP